MKLMQDAVALIPKRIETVKHDTRTAFRGITNQC
jgi:hypothetical protein